ncbi:MAG TPA: ribokinase [Pseudonocardia sp.]|nr:ribokinase [Pseudonocardia sp.]
MPETDSPLVVVIGSVNIDHVVVADAFPSPGETIMGKTALVTLGGKGSNQAVAAALGGARTAMIARVGEDAEGERARAGLAGHGVDVHGVASVPDDETGTAWITVAAGDNTIIVIAGANHRWPADGDPLEGSGETAAVVLTQLEVPVDVVQRAAANTRGQFLLNAAPAAELPDELIELCDVLIVNEHEQAVVARQTASGDDPSDPAVVRHAHLALRERGAGAVVTTLGSAGAIVTDAEGTTTAIGSPPATVVDTTGAGDAFAGVLAARLAAGDSLLEAARWGTAAGSLAVRATGAQESYADLDTLSTLVEGN